MTLDRGERCLGPLGALAVDQLGDRQTLELGGQMAKPTALGRVLAPLRRVLAPLGRALAPSGPVLALVARAVVRHGKRGGRPEDPLDDAALHPHGDSVRQQGIDEHAVAADRVDAEHHRQGRRPAAPDQDQAPGLRFRDGALSAPPSAQRLTPCLDFLASSPVASDALEVAAGCGVASQLLERGLERVDIRLRLANALEVLILAERRLDTPAQDFRGRAGREEERHRAVPELELALDRLGRAVDHPENVLESVAGIEGDDARAFGIDPATPRPARHLSQLVVRKGAKPTVRPLGQALQDDRPGRHVDAERHRLRREDDLAEPALEEQLDEPLEARQDPGVVEPDTEAQRLEHTLVERGLGDGRALAEHLADRRVHFPLLRGSEQALPFGEDVLHCPLASDPAEDEVDGRQPSPRGERIDQDRRMNHASRVPPAPGVRTARLVADHPCTPGADPCELVDLASQVRDDVRERHRSMRVVDGDDRPMDDRDPIGDLLDVGDGRREPDEHDVARSADDDLFPHGAASLVAHVVALVEHDVAEIVEAAPVERIPEDLRGHDEDGGVRIHLDVAGEDPDRVRAERAGEIGELLVGERLERGRVR